MTTVKDVLLFIESIAPPHTQEPWDNCGLLCGRGEREVHRILAALDPFRGVIQEAADWDAQLLVTHHPLIFGEGIKAVTGETETGRNLLALIEHGIAAINAHTNLDMTAVNDCLAARLGLSDVQVIAPGGTDEIGLPWGLLRRGVVAEQTMEDFLPFVKEALGCPGLRYVSSGRPVHLVCVGGGACGGELYAAADAGCDTFVTADVKYNQFWSAQDAGLNLIDAGHFYTENPVVPYLAWQLQAAFPEVEVRISQTHRDCMRFY